MGQTSDRLSGKSEKREPSAVTENSEIRRVGIWGGTFDPIHVGHLLIAQQALEQLNLQQIRWIPAATAPHAQLKNAIDPNDRLEMVKLATAGHSSFIVDQRELRRGGNSYTVETLAELNAEFPLIEWVLLIGADSLVNLSQWREPAKICRLARVVVVSRGGQPPPDLNLLNQFLPESKSLQQLVAEHQLTMPQIEISSTDIRQRVLQGRSIRYMVPAAVEAYIQSKGLYQGNAKKLLIPKPT